MKIRKILTNIAGVVFLTAYTGVGTAFAATTTPTTSATTRIQNIQSHANNWITTRIDSINAFLAYIHTSSVANSLEAQSAISALNTDLTGLNNLKIQIDAFSDPTQIKTTLLPLVKDIFTQYRVYAIELPKDHLLIHSAMLENLSNEFSKHEDIMNNAISYAQNQSKDVTTLQADETAYKNEVTKFTTDLQTVQTAIKVITPADFQKGVSAFTQVKADLTVVHADMKAVQADFTTFIHDYNKLFNIS